MALTNVWNEALPTDDNYGFELDDYQRKMRLDVRERLAVQHKAYLDESGHDDVAEHTPGECNIFFVGEKSAFPVPATSNSGCIAVATDETNQIYYWTGSAWAKLQEPVLITGDQTIAGDKTFTGVSVFSNAGCSGDFDPTGSLRMWPTDTPPSNWLLCYGQAISRTTYSDLFGVIGTTFGVGDGEYTFNVPDFRGRVPLGQDDMGGSSADRITNAQADDIGGAAGTENHTLTIAEMPSHAHTIDVRTGLGDSYQAASTTSDTPEYVNSGSVGGGGAHNNVQPYLTVNYIIKT